MSPTIEFITNRSRVTTLRMIRLRVVIPCLILAIFVLDGGLKFAITPDQLAFRSWEAAKSFGMGKEGPFTPDFVYARDGLFGDLANLGNVRWMRQYHHESFSSDNWGFRATPAAGGAETTTLVLGDSFISGAGLSDNETLPAQLSVLSGEGVYNGGGVYGSDAWPASEALIRRLKLNKGLVIYEHSARYEIPAAVQAQPASTHGIQSLLASRDSVFHRGMRSANRLLLYSPLKILLTRQFSALRNDRVLPNTAAGEVAIRKLRNGQPLLFYPGELANFSRIRKTDIDFFVQLKTLVRRTGNDLLVILIPDKYAVYSSLLEEHPAHEQPYLDVIEQKLTKAGIAVLDLTPGLRQQATALLPHSKYTYQLDDTHWNAAAVRCAAEEILQFRGSAM